MAPKLMLPGRHIGSWHSVRGALGHRSWGAFRGWGQYLAIALPALSMKCTGEPRALCTTLQPVLGLAYWYLL